MEKHITVLGILYIVFSALGIIGAIILFTVLAGVGMVSHDESALTVLTIIGTVAAAFLIVISLPGIVGGIGLLKWQPWARVLVLILGFLNLINIPFGTILGAYTIWALMNNETIAVFDAKRNLNRQPV